MIQRNAYSVPPGPNGSNRGRPPPRPPGIPSPPPLLSSTSSFMYTAREGQMSITYGPNCPGPNKLPPPPPNGFRSPLKSGRAGYYIARNMTDRLIVESEWDTYHSKSIIS
jgi:hypothetical protein